jgi:hypothetical protein
MIKGRICQAVEHVFAAYPEPGGRQGLVSGGVAYARHDIEAYQ